MTPEGDASAADATRTPLERGGLGERPSVADRNDRGRNTPLRPTSRAAGVALPLPREATVFAAIFVLALAPLVSTPVLPFVDLYNHVARFFVLAKLASTPVFQANYASHWGLLPNIGMDVFGVAAMHVLPATIAGHVFAFIIIAVQYGGVLYFNRCLTGRWSPLVAVLAAPLLYSYVLNWGFANFLLGLGLTFWAAGWWLTHRRNLVVALPAACLFAVILFLTHGLAFGLYGVLVASLEVGLFLDAPTRRIGDLVGRLAAVLVQAIAPAVLFVIWAISKAPGKIDVVGDKIVRFSQAGGLVGRLLEEVVNRATALVRVEEGPTLWFDAATFALQLGVIGFLLWKGRGRLVRPAWLALAAGILLTVAIPPNVVGVGNIADRMPLFLALTALGALSFDLGGQATDRLCAGLLAATAVARLVAIALGWQVYAADYAQFRTVAAAIPHGALIDDVRFAHDRPNWDSPRCSMYGPLLVSLAGDVAPLFANEAQQPLRLIGPLGRAVNALPTPVDQRRLPLEYAQAVVDRGGSAGFRYLLVCNPLSAAMSLPPDAQVIARTPTFTVLRLGGGS